MGRPILHRTDRVFTGPIANARDIPVGETGPSPRGRIRRSRLLATAPVARRTVRKIPLANERGSGARLGVP